MDRLIEDVKRIIRGEEVSLEEDGRTQILVQQRNMLRQIVQEIMNISKINEIQILESQSIIQELGGQLEKSQSLEKEKSELLKQVAQLRESVFERERQISLLKAEFEVSLRGAEQRCRNLQQTLTQRERELADCQE